MAGDGVMLKVLYLMNHAGKAGSEAYVQSLVERLHGSHIKAYFAYNEEGLLVERLGKLGVDTYRIVMRNPFDIAAVWQLSRLCRKLGIDLIHTQYLRENYIALLSRIFNPRVKVMYTNHFILPNNLILRICNRILTRLQANIVAVCNKGRDMMIKNGNDGGKITVIYNGVDPKIWGKPSASTLRSELGMDEDIFLILCGSRFYYDKGHKFLVNSISELKKITDKRFKCILASDGPLLEEIKNYVRSKQLEDDIIFIGPRKDMKNVYDGSNMYVNSSWHEALSFAIIEALAEGLPVVATDMGGNPEIINEETKCGILVKYDDAKGMAEAINKVMNDGSLQAELRKSGIDAVYKKFNLDKMVMETYNLYEKSCAGKK
jgi:glycosyltransferase involved in cell wall biosynthesis